MYMSRQLSKVENGDMISSRSFTHFKSVIAPTRIVRMVLTFSKVWYAIVYTYGFVLVYECVATYSETSLFWSALGNNFLTLLDRFTL